MIKATRHGKGWRVAEWIDGKVVWRKFPSEELAASYCNAKTAAKSAGCPTLTRLADEYIADWLAYRSPLTVKNTRSVFRQIAIKTENPLDLQDSTLLKNHILSGKRYTTQLLWLRKINRLAQFTQVKYGISLKIPYIHVKQLLKRDDSKTKICLTDEEIGAILRHEGASCYIWKFMAAYGVRVRELCNLRVGDLRTDNRSLTIRKEIAKSRRERSFIVDRVLVGNITDRCNTKDMSAPLFPNDHGGFRSPESLANNFRELTRKVLGKPRNIHLLRACAFKTLMRGAMGNFEVVRKIAGWDSAEMKKYSGGIDAELEATANNIPHIIDGYFNGETLMPTQSVMIEAIRKMIKRYYTQFKVPEDFGLAASAGISPIEWRELLEGRNPQTRVYQYESILVSLGLTFHLKLSEKRNPNHR